MGEVIKKVYSPQPRSIPPYNPVSSQEIPSSIKTGSILLCVTGVRRLYIVRVFLLFFLTYSFSHFPPKSIFRNVLADDILHWWCLFVFYAPIVFYIILSVVFRKYI